MTRNSARPTVALIPPSCCGAGYFRRVRRLLGGRIDVLPVELPGHGRRYREERLTDAALAVPDVVAQLRGPVDVLYGESLGAYIGLLAVAALAPARQPLLIAASNSPPSTHPDITVEDVSSLESAAAALTAAGGEIPEEILTEPALARSAYPLIRDDLCLSQSFIEATRTTTVATDIVVLGGTDDASLVRLDAWAAHTTGSCEVVQLPGRHLLSAENPAGVAAAILRSLARKCTPEGTCDGVGHGTSAGDRQSPDVDLPAAGRRPTGDRGGTGEGGGTVPSAPRGR
ncbi:thioesterase II family protein [Streptomyces noursei]|uniref:thioesterase II family protein n=1 Tax=Streptomyces noursei TaxID=1971 RepID=UPI0019AD1AC7|nr:alpha/beta fold hydrolase [Streptomyces noursei]GGX41715.1 pyoverdine biosynthesis protein PvdG [Streptomyces noursei]